MKLMAEGWTEERLDDLKQEVGKQGARLERLEDRMDAGFRDLREEMDRRFDGVDKRFEGLDSRLYAMHRMLFLFLGSMVVGTLSLVVTLVAAQV